MDTFMVRVWTAAADDVPPGLRGTAVHLGSGTDMTFADSAGLIQFLVNATAAAAGRSARTEAGSPGEKRVQQRTGNGDG